MIWLFPAFAHPVGGHRLDHTIDWKIDLEGSSIIYVIDVPHVLEPTDGVLDSLSRGLILQQNAHTLTWEHVDGRTRELHQGTRASLHLRAQHPPGVLHLSDGNLPEATSRISTRIQLHRDLDLIRAPETPQATSTLARTIKIEVSQSSWLTRLHRWSTQPGSFRVIPEPSTNLWSNQSTPLTAVIGSTLLGTLGLLSETQRTSQAFAIGLGVVGLFFTWGGAWATLAVLLSLVAYKRPHLIRVALVALANATNLWGLGLLLALIFSIQGRGGSPHPWIVFAGGLLACVQMFRVL